MKAAGHDIQYLKARDRLIVALDFSSTHEAEALISSLGEAVSFYKIGYQLALSGGLELARDLAADGRNIFLDMKLLDIDNTIAHAVESAAKLGVSMLTIHAYPKAMGAAVEALAAVNGSGLTLLGVTVLTSMDDADLKDAGYGMGAADLVRKRARQAVDAGMGGVVCAAAEAEAVKTVLGEGRAIVTPGIRPHGSEQDDQKRVASPASALRAGATHLVVGRPITGAPDPKTVADAIVAQMNGVLSEPIEKRRD